MACGVCCGPLQRIRVPTALVLLFVGFIDLGRVECGFEGASRDRVSQVGEREVVGESKLTDAQNLLTPSCIRDFNMLTRLSQYQRLQLNRSRVADDSDCDRPCTTVYCTSAWQESCVEQIKRGEFWKDCSCTVVWIHSDSAVDLVDYGPVFAQDSSVPSRYSQVCNDMGGWYCHTTRRFVDAASGVALEVSVAMEDVACLPDVCTWDVNLKIIAAEYQSQCPKRFGGWSVRNGRDCQIDLTCSWCAASGCKDRRTVTTRFSRGIIALPDDAKTGYGAGNLPRADPWVGPFDVSHAGLFDTSRSPPVFRGSLGGAATLRPVVGALATAVAAAWQLVTVRLT